MSGKLQITGCEYVESVTTQNTGGHCMVDFITLKSGQVIGISGDVVCLYADADAVANGTPVEGKEITL